MNLMRDYGQFLEQVADRYKKAGYKVAVEPKAATLPPFLKGFRPDLVAKRGKDRVIVEVKRGDRTQGRPKLKAMAERVNAQPGWQFEIVLFDPATSVRPKKPSTRLVRSTLQRSVELFENSDKFAAFLLAWSAFEAAGRVVVEKFEEEPFLSDNPADLLKALVSLGELSEENFGELMNVLRVRNRVAHGELGVPISKKTFNNLSTIVESLVETRSRNGRAA